MLRNSKSLKRAKTPSQHNSTIAKPRNKKSTQLKTKAKRSFSTTTFDDNQDNTTAPLAKMRSHAFKQTRKVSSSIVNLAFPDDYDPGKNVQPPHREPVFEATKLIADMEPHYNEKLALSNNSKRRFDNSEDEQLYDFLEKSTDQIKTKPDFEDFARAKATLHHLNSSDVVEFSHKDERFPWLDPFNPPNLTYQHVKLLKNIDYSPLIKRANEGGMFTVEDVITILQEEGISDAFKTSMRREHAQDPVIYGKTFDVFNRGRKPCPLCLPDPTVNKVNRIHYTNVNMLRKFISTSGMILPRKVSGVCQMHQTKLRYAIKNAKQLALLSFTSNWHVPLSYVDPEKFESYEDQNAAADIERERRMEIKQLFDNLVQDKRALLAGKSVEELEQDKADAAARKASADKALLDRQRAAAAADGEELDQSAPLEGKALDDHVREQQHDARIKQLQERFQAQLSKANGDEDKVAEIKKAYEAEEKNIVEDYQRATAEAHDENMDALRSDFGDLLNLDNFDIQMTFDEFLSKYNKRVEAKNPKAADHADLLLLDSEDGEKTTVGMRLRAAQVQEMIEAEEKKKDLM